jgi:uncharacterized protein (TIRG00374 family)
MKKLVSLTVSVLILAAAYLLIDTKALIGTLRATSPKPLALSLLLLIALVVVSAIRLKILAKASGLAVALPTAMAATFAANALNLFLPARMGDIAKATMLRNRDDGSVLPAVNISIYEKVTDVFAVFAWGMLALVGTGHAKHGFSTPFIAGVTIGLGFLLFSATPGRWLLQATRMVRAPNGVERYLHAWNAIVEVLLRRPFATALVVLLSAAIWAGHFLQIGLMSWALGVEGPWLALGSALPLVILAGLAPFTFAGIGTRDLVIILLLDL